MQTFVLCAAAIANKNCILVASRTLQQITAIYAADDGTNCRHFDSLLLRNFKVLLLLSKWSFSPQGRGNLIFEALLTNHPLVLF